MLVCRFAERASVGGSERQGKPVVPTGVLDEGKDEAEDCVPDLVPQRGCCKFATTCPVVNGKDSLRERAKEGTFANGPETCSCSTVQVEQDSFARSKGLTLLLDKIPEDAAANHVRNERVEKVGYPIE